MNLASVAGWIKENQPLINFGLLIGAVVYTIITGFILRVSARQLKTTVQPVFTLKGSAAGTKPDNHQPYLYNLAVLTFQNSGNGTALNVATMTTVHLEGLHCVPRFGTEEVKHPAAIAAGQDFKLGVPHTAVESHNDCGNVSYKQLHPYEAFLLYDSIAGARYLTHISIGAAGTINSFYVERRSLGRRALLWSGIIWRFYLHRVRILR